MFVRFKDGSSGINYLYGKKDIVALSFHLEHCGSGVIGKHMDCINNFLHNFCINKGKNKYLIQNIQKSIFTSNTFFCFALSLLFANEKQNSASAVASVNSKSASSETQSSKNNH